MSKIAAGMFVIGAVLVSTNVQAQQLNHSQDTFWLNLLNQAQANKWEMARGCYTNDGTLPPYCTISYISPPSDGKRLQLMGMFDAHEKLESRSVCSISVVTTIRSCFYLEPMVSTDEMYDDTSKTWVATSRQQLSYNPLAQPSTSTNVSVSSGGFGSQAGRSEYVQIKSWDSYVSSSGRYITRILQSTPTPGLYRLLARDHDVAGNSNGESVCSFNANGWSDCVNNEGAHYQLKPQSIKWFINIAGGAQP